MSKEKLRTKKINITRQSKEWLAKLTMRGKWFWEDPVLEEIVSTGEITQGYS